MTQTTTFIASDHPIPAGLRAALDRLLDLMIPASADGRMPSAGALDLYADRGRLGDPAVATLCEGLRGLEELARERLGRDVAELDSAAATMIVDEYRNVAPRFFRVFVTQSAARYYQHDKVMTALGLEPRAPWPEGNEIPDGDWSLLDPVRERAGVHGKLYRE